MVQRINRRFVSSCIGLSNHASQHPQLKKGGEMEKKMSRTTETDLKVTKMVMLFDQSVSFMRREYAGRISNQNVSYG